MSLSKTFFKALGVFGSLEGLKMLCSIARTKLVAVWIGTAGVGVITLYNATIDMLKSVAMLNIRQSSVPAIAGEEDEEAQRLLCRHVDMLGIIIGLIATIVVALCAPLLSKATFGDTSYSWGFALLAPTMLFSVVGEARSGILQGVGRLKALALASFLGVLVSTLFAIPLFYFFRMAAIVPVLIVYPAFTALFLFITPGTRLKYPPFDGASFRAVAKGLVRLGSFLTVGMAMGFVADYILRIYIERVGGVECVGIFQSGYIIIKSYVGIFFAAITMEYFPRLSATIDNRRQTSMVVSGEIMMALWILMPVIVVFVALNDWAVIILYSSSFLSVVPYITIAVSGTLLRAVSWCFSYVIIAKGDGKMYIVTECISAVSLLVFSWIGWNWGGFAGLGWAYIGQFVMFTAATWIVCHVRYGVKIPRGIVALVFASMAVGLGAVALREFVGWWATFILLVPVAVVFLARRKRILRK